MKKIYIVCLLVAILCALLAGCGETVTTPETSEEAVDTYTPATVEQLLSQEADTQTYEVTLTPEQVEQFASAKFYIMRRFGENRFLPFYLGTNVTLEGDKLVAHYNGKLIYFLNDAGLCTPLLTWEEDTVDGKTSYRVELTCENAQLPDGTVQEGTKTYQLRMVYDRQTGTLINSECVMKTNKDTIPAPEDLFTTTKDTLQIPQTAECSFNGGAYCYIGYAEDGTILPCSMWEEDGRSWFEIAAGKGARLIYGRAATITSPYDMNISQLCLVMQIENQDGTGWCAEPIPVTVLQTQMPTVEEPVLEVDWQEGNSVCLLNQDGVSVILRKQGKYTSNGGGITYVMELKNSSDVKVNMGMTELLYNDHITGKAKSIYAVEPGTWKEGWEFEFGPEIEALQGPISSMSFRMKLEDSTLYTGTTLFDQKVRVTFSEETAIQPDIWSPATVIDTPYMEFLAAENQPVLERDGVCVTLLRMGGKSSGNLQCVVRMENTTRESRWLSYGGMVINGIYLSNLDIQQLQPGEICYKTYYVWGSDLEEQRVEAIGDVSILFDTGRGTAHSGNENLISYPVVAEEKAQTPSTLEAGQMLLFEEEGVRVSLMETVTENGKTTWYLLAENRQDTHMTLTAFDCFTLGETGEQEAFKGVSIRNNNVAAYSSVLANLSVQNLNQPVYIYLRLCTLDGNTILLESKEPICLTP